MKRRDFLRISAAGASVLALTRRDAVLAAAGSDPLFKISLAQWSLNPLLFSGEMDNLDFARAAKEHGIDGIEYVNQFFMDKATDSEYLAEMKNRADGEGVTSVLIMCDREGRLGDPDEGERRIAVENHFKWVEAAKFLGCHSIRVNGYSEGTYDEQKSLVADGLHQLCEFADGHDLNVIIENHGGFSSNARWLMDVMKLAEHPRAGTLPDFGNFRISGDESYDSYQGVTEMMPLARGVSVKPTAWDAEGGQHELDYERMMRIVLDAGYRGWCGIEHGPRGAEWEGILAVRDRLIEVRELLAAAY